MATLLNSVQLKTLKEIITNYETILTQFGLYQFVVSTLKLIKFHEDLTTTLPNKETVDRVKETLRIDKPMFELMFQPCTINVPHVLLTLIKSQELISQSLGQVNCES